MVPDSDAGHSHQVTTLYPCISSSISLHNAQADPLFRYLSQTCTSLWLPLQNGHIADGPSKQVSIASMYCETKGRSVGGMAVSGLCLPLPALHSLHSVRQWSTVSMTWTYCMVEAKSLSIFFCLYHPYDMMECIALSSSSGAVLSVLNLSLFLSVPGINRLWSKVRHRAMMNRELPSVLPLTDIRTTLPTRNLFANDQVGIITTFLRDITKRYNLRDIL